MMVESLAYWSQRAPLLGTAGSTRFWASHSCSTSIADRGRTVNHMIPPVARTACGRRIATCRIRRSISWTKPAPVPGFRPSASLRTKWWGLSSPRARWRKCWGSGRESQQRRCWKRQSWRFDGAILRHLSEVQVSSSQGELSFRTRAFLEANTDNWRNRRVMCLRRSWQAGLQNQPEQSAGP